MYHKIAEPVSVAGIYEHSAFRPVKFRWKQRLLTITEVCSVHDFKDGSIFKRRFSVAAEGTVYLLEFDRYRESWSLEEIWVND
jgi:hypothetical protein